ncbi:hypothetical protein SRU_0202 [Salinibacter ruber DSM 13855]|uniref:Uncharacterized protein n=1 Tax=Salinibacter ruber (strain DSM 13855 / M31) TaxID=309807 RepID=Q2S628_SALRD|nr:hypothetical protein SRU_0202 [Salinibacter ruber DSM 13855]
MITRKGRDVAQIKAVKEVAREDSLPSLEESRASVTVSGEDLSETVRQQRWEHRDRVLSECAGSIATECFQSALGASRPSAFRVRWEHRDRVLSECAGNAAKPCSRSTHGTAPHCPCATCPRSVLLICHLHCPEK